MKSIEEVNEYLIENRTDEFGSIDLEGLVFPKSKSVYIGNMKVGGSLYQDHQTVKYDIVQDGQTAGRMYLQDTTGMEKGYDGSWRKIKTLTEKIAKSNLDDETKAQILSALKGK